MRYYRTINYFSDNIVILSAKARGRNMGINFGENLKDFIVSKTMTPEQLAEALHVSRSTVYAWMKDATDIKLSNLLLIAEFFHCSIESLIGEETDDSEKIFHECPPFSQRLRAVMQEKEITTYMLIRTTRFSSKHFYNWAHGTDPQLSTLVDLAKILDCTVDYLVGREN